MACDDRQDILSVMQYTWFPPNVPVAIRPNINPAAYGACAPLPVNPRHLCSIRTVGNTDHPNPAAGPGATTTRRTVCNHCDQYSRMMCACDRFLLNAAPTFIRSEERVFRDRNPVWPAGWNPGQHHSLGAHTLGNLCRECQNEEIANYFQRWIVEGGDWQAVANTCRCEALLRKRLCYGDRQEVLLDVEQRSGHNAAWPANFLQWLQYNPATRRAESAVTPAAQAALLAVRGPGTGNETNGCRCGRAIATANVAYTANGTPTPVAMCTACDGIIIDTNSPIVAGWRARARPRRPAGRREANLRLGRNVPHV